MITCGNQARLACAQVERKTVVGLLLLIESERRGDAVDRALLAKLLRCFSALGIYAGAFQAPFLTQTGEFYAAEGLQLMASTDVPEYLQHCEVRTCAEATHVGPGFPEADRPCTTHTLLMRRAQSAVCRSKVMLWRLLASGL